MKKIVALLVLGCASMSWAESVSSVTYNPSRLGEYTHLKVSSHAILRGGLKTPTLNINSGGNVTMKNKLLFSSSGLSKYSIEHVYPKTGTSGGSISMENIVFKGADSNDFLGATYEATSTDVPSSRMDRFLVYGGNVTFNEDSYMTSLNVIGSGSDTPQIRINAGKIIIPKLKVTNQQITNSYTFYVPDGTTGLPGSGRGFVLGGRDIRYPSQSSTGTTISNVPTRRLCWFKYPVKVDDKNFEAFLLGLQESNKVCP